MKFKSGDLVKVKSAGKFAEVILVVNDSNIRIRLIDSFNDNNYYWAKAELLEVEPKLNREYKKYKDFLDKLNEIV